MHRLRVPFPPYPLVDHRLQRTEIDVSDLSANPADQVVVVTGHPHDIAIPPLLPVHPLENAKTQEQVDGPEQGRPAKIRMSFLHAPLKIRDGKDPGKMDKLRHNGGTLWRQPNTMVLDGPTHLFNRIHGDPFLPMSGR